MLHKAGGLLNPALCLFVVLAFHARALAQHYGENFKEKLVAAAIERTKHLVTYDGNYRKIGYPGGDVPDDRGVCTDVIIRCYRAVGVDLQKEVHQDISAFFSAYPQLWGLTKPDANIDHRRVPNLYTFFKRKGIEVAVTNNPNDYQPGDIVFWMLALNRPHIGIVVDQRSPDGKRPLVVHNIGLGPMLEDTLFEYELYGHFRYPCEVWEQAE
jgi:uncharacterized protein YijF (DUF1287 family)